MLVPLDFYRAQIHNPCTPETEELCISANARKKLDKIGIGNHTYLVLMFGRFREVVRYTHVENFADAHYKTQINVERAQEGTVRKTFPIGSCLAFIWTEQAIKEFTHEVSE